MSASHVRFVAGARSLTHRAACSKQARLLLLLPVPPSRPPARLAQWPGRRPRTDRTNTTDCRSYVTDALPLCSTSLPSPLAALAVLAVCAAAAAQAEAHTRWGKALTAPLLAMVAGAAAAYLGWLPHSHAVYDAVRSTLLPLCVALCLLEGDPTRLAASGRPVVAAFALGAATMAAGAAVAWLLLSQWLPQPGAAPVAAALLASSVGGAVNFAAVASATRLPPGLAPPALAADNMAMLLLLMPLLLIPRATLTGASLQRWRTRRRLAAAAAAWSSGDRGGGQRALDGGPLLTPAPGEDGGTTSGCSQLLAPHRELAASAAAAVASSAAAAADAPLPLLPLPTCSTPDSAEAARLGSMGGVAGGAADADADAGSVIASSSTPSGNMDGRAWPAPPPPPLPPVSGALALDGGALLTEAPQDGAAMAAAAAAARARGASGRVSLKSSTISSLASSDGGSSGDELELLARLSPQQLADSLARQRTQAAAAATATDGASSPGGTRWRQQQRRSGDNSSDSSSSSSTRMTPASIAAALAAAAAAAAVSEAAASALGAPSLHMLLLSITALCLAHAAPRAAAALRLSAGAAAPHPFAGATQLGSLGLGLFFAVLGIGCAAGGDGGGAAAAARLGPMLAFALTMGLVHWVLLALLGGLLLRLPAEALVAGSAANLAGPASAAAIMSARGVRELAPATLFAGGLGYAVGTGVGLAFARALGAA